MVYIYILELENNKYYIGRTKNPNFRLDQHFNSAGSIWTKKHKPIKIVDIISNCDNFDEDKYTLKYMEKYGINNVRGGIFCKLVLDKNEIAIIRKFINGSSDNCYICGNNGHFAKECNRKYISKKSIDKIEEGTDEESEEKPFTKTQKNKPKNESACEKIYSILRYLYIIK